VPPFRLGKLSVERSTASRRQTHVVVPWCLWLCAIVATRTFWSSACGCERSKARTWLFSPQDSNEVHWAQAIDVRRAVKHGASATASPVRRKGSGASATMPVS